MKKEAFELGVAQAFADAGLTKTAGPPFRSVNDMKDNVYRQQKQQQQGIAPTRALDPTKGPAQALSVPTSSNPEAVISGASKVTPAVSPKPRTQPQTAAFGSGGAAAPAKKVQPSAFGTEQYEKGWSPGGSVQTAQDKRRRALKGIF